MPTAVLGSLSPQLSNLGKAEGYICFPELLNETGYKILQTHIVRYPRQLVEPQVNAAGVRVREHISIVREEKPTSVVTIKSEGRFSHVPEHGLRLNEWGRLLPKYAHHVIWDKQHPLENVLEGSTRTSLECLVAPIRTIGPLWVSKGLGVHVVADVPGPRISDRAEYDGTLERGRNFSEGEMLSVGTAGTPFWEVEAPREEPNQIVPYESAPCAGNMYEDELICVDHSYAAYRSKVYPKRLMTMSSLWATHLADSSS